MSQGFYPSYNNQFYMQDLQNMRDRIDQQMRQMQQPIPNQQQTPQINQTFQLAPNQANNNVESKIVKSIDEVKNTFVINLGIFATEDYSKIWIKDSSGAIREFATQEIIEIDERDKQIADLQKQKETDNATILMLKEEIENIKKSMQTSMVSMTEEKRKNNERS